MDFRKNKNIILKKWILDKARISDLKKWILDKAKNQTKKRILDKTEYH